MVRIIDNKDIKAVVAVNENGDERTLQYAHKNPKPIHFFPGVGGPTVEKLVDIDTGGKGPKTKLIGYQLGITSSTSGHVSEKFMDSAPEIQEAFVKAGFQKPEITTPTSTHVKRFIHNGLRRVFG